MPRRAKTPSATRAVTNVRGSKRPLAGRVAVVAGATRGAGRGIARGLAEAGAIVYCTGRSVRGNLSHYGRPETLDETAEMITAAGGTAIAVRVDHSIEAEVEALFERIDREHGRVDVLADSVGGENPLMGQYGWFWTTDLKNGKAVFEQSLTKKTTIQRALYRRCDYLPSESLNRRSSCEQPRAAHGSFEKNFPQTKVYCISIQFLTRVFSPSRARDPSAVLACLRWQLR